MTMSMSVLGKQVALGVAGGITTAVAGTVVGMGFDKKIIEAQSEGDEKAAKAWAWGKVVAVGATTGVLTGATTALVSSLEVTHEAAFATTNAVALPEVEPIVLHF